MAKQKNTRKRTGDILAEALEQVHAPSLMIKHAREGYYDDYRSELVFPIRQLMKDAQANGLTTIADRAKRGDFDAQKWEADEWAKSAEGQQTFNQLFRRKM